MNVTDTTIAAAILQVFRDVRVFHAGGTLYVETIEASWDQCGLRTRDLEPGLAWLVSNGLLTRRSNATPDDKALVSLTQAGADQICQLPHGLREWVKAIDAAWTLAAARRRSQSNQFWNRVRCSFHGFRPDAL
jgi:hypothetical protein